MNASPPDQTVPTLTDRDLWLLAKAIADHVFECVAKATAKDEWLWMEDRRTESLNPCYGQVTAGLWLEHYYGMPSRILTPWGKWGFGGSGCGEFDDVWADVCKQVEVVEEIPVHHSEWGTVGPFFRIVSFRGQTLPVGTLRRPEDHLLFDDVKEAFEQVSGQEM